jgi:flagellar hook-associated protein 1
MTAITDDLQKARVEADRGIAVDVQRLNDGLRTVARIDTQIVGMTARGEDTGALQDERQQLIDTMAEIVPLREVPRPDGSAALVTTGGLVLLDGRVATISFTPTRAIAPEFSLAGGDLSGLSIDGRPVATNAPPGLMDGGALAARFAIRDTAAPDAQAALDTLARDLVERLADPALDPSRSSGAPGLLTDAGLALDPIRETGLAGRLALNPLIDPAAGGALFRLRDGLGAAVPGPAGDGALLVRATALLAEPRSTAGGGLPAGRRNLQDVAADVLSAAATLRLSAESRDSAVAAQARTLRDAVAAGGVNTDAEMQRLLALEQAYAANARVLSVVDRLFAELLEATR